MVDRIKEFFRKPKVTVVAPSYEIMFPDKEEAEKMFSRVERIARICYKSEDSITETSKFKFIERLVRKGHTAMIEHSMMTVRFSTTRGFSHELCRHRMASFAQESQRYVSSANELVVICPPEILSEPQLYKLWLKGIMNDAKIYSMLIKCGLTPQIARSKLPNCTKTEIVISANWRSWRNIFQLRTARDAHPEMRALMIPLLAEAKLLFPVIFDDIVVSE